MSYYERELRALKRSKRFRKREVVDSTLLDFASNDYLGLSHNKALHTLTCQKLNSLPIHSSKASLLVNGYHQIHKDFEEALCKANDFEDAVVVGSGFNANIAMIEALCRRDDIVLMDEKYHASGVMATNFESVNVEFFTHNDMYALEKLLQMYREKANRIIVCVEGIYSMDGNLVPKEVFRLCDSYDALLIVDEAHSSGVVGERLMGVFDLYNITPKPNHIKMGTLGKAYGSFGAYILASKHIIEYLINRAKPLIYATSLSLYDTLLAHNALHYILEHANELHAKIDARKAIVQKELGLACESLIVPIVIGDNAKVIHIKETLRQDGFAIGAIRQPTVPSAILRIIARLGESEDDFTRLCQMVAKFR
jgi:8-amino-7-oxononanoate synthase